MLERIGYNVLATAKPTEALRLVEQYPGEIHLLITDVVMPDINGRELAVITSYSIHYTKLYDAVAADVVDIGRNILAGAVNRVPALSYQPEFMKEPKITPMGELSCPFYFRITALDQPGVLSYNFV